MRRSISGSTEQRNSASLEEQTFAVSKFWAALLLPFHSFRLRVRLTPSCKEFQNNQYRLIERIFASDQSFWRTYLSVTMKPLHLSVQMVNLAYTS